ncbi:MAG: DNA-methyltransferase [Fusobacteriaceae bacterium]
MIEIFEGDSKELIKNIKDSSIDCIVTSPPYYNLRDYGHEKQFGREETPEEFTENLCNLFDEIKRVLKDDGTIFVNLGDTYAGNGSIAKTGRRGFLKGEENIKLKKGNGQARRKSLIGIPAMFQLEMIKRGWILRNKIIWHKPNCMPEKVQDRFTNDYEEIFFFSKNEKYFFKNQYEPFADKTLNSFKNGVIPKSHSYLEKSLAPGKSKTGMRKTQKDWVSVPNLKGRNMRTVWKVATKGTKFNHYSTFPQEIAKRCIKSSCKENGIVFDPFAGSGTTLFVASMLGFDSIGFELNKDNFNYIKQNICNYAKNLQKEFEQNKLF